MTVAARRRRCVGRAVAFLAAVSALPAFAEEGAPPVQRCFAAAHAPIVVATSPVALPDAIWTTKPSFTADLRFHVDDAGSPRDVDASITGVDADDKAALGELVGQAFAHYRFCARADYPADRVWKAKLMFTPAKKRGDVEAPAAWYLQQFKPAYVGLERPGAHTGQVVVRSDFGADGRPRAVAVATSSGDKVLDDKSLDSMATALLVFRPGAEPTKPVVVSQPFIYRQ